LNEGTAVVFPLFITFISSLAHFELQRTPFMVGQPIHFHWRTDGYGTSRYQNLDQQLFISRIDCSHDDWTKVCGHF
jgi:hypothetical protein